MALPLEKVEAEALELSSEDRTRLVLRLLDSLEEERREDEPAEVERAWEEEIRRRIAEIDAGTMEMIPAEQVFAELRARRTR